MKYDVEWLVEATEKAFADVSGPPRITLTVARGVDDHQYDSLDRLALQQSHHVHWSAVTQEEMDQYHNCWAFMDAEAVRFYLPAFLMSHLEELLDPARDESLDPEWFPLECITLGTEKLVELSGDQVAVVSDYLWFIELELQRVDDEAEFRQTRQAWERNISAIRGDQ